MGQYFPPHITTHVADALNQLLAQYGADRAPVIRAIVSVEAQRWQEIEDAFFQLLTQRGLNTAVGAQLDVLGEILGQPRNGLADAAYRAVLFIRIAELNSFGTAEEIIGIFKFLTNADRVQLKENFPAKFQITAIGGTPPSVPFQSINQVLQQCKAAGVGFLAVSSTGSPFVFAGDPSGLGFGGATAGGRNVGQGGDFSGAIG